MIGATALLVSACSGDRSAADLRTAPSNALSLDTTPRIFSTPTSDSTKTVSISWLALTDAVGPVRIGQRIAEVARIVQTTVRLDLVEKGASCGYAYLNGAPPGVAIMLDGDSVVRVDVDSVGVRTPESLGVGSSERDLLERYQRRAQVSPHKYEGPRAHYVTVSTPGDTLNETVFETDARGIVQRFRVGRRAFVALVEGCS